MSVYYQVEAKPRPGCEEEFDDLRTSLRGRPGWGSSNWAGAATPAEKDRLDQIGISPEETLSAARVAWPNVELDAAAGEAALSWYSQTPWDPEEGSREGALLIAKAINPHWVQPFFSAKWDTGCVHGGSEPASAASDALEAFDRICDELRTMVPAVETMETWEIVPRVERLFDEFEEREIYGLTREEQDRWLDDRPDGSLCRAANATRRWHAARWFLFWSSHGHRVFLEV